MIQNQLYEPKICQNFQNPNQSKKKKDCCKNANMFACYDIIKKDLIPLKFAKYYAKILPGFCIVELEITYSTHKQQEPIELESVFSINENAAITKMVVELGESKVYSVIKEKEKAKQEYQQGLTQGQTMAYIDQDVNFPQIKRVKIGQLEPNKQLKIIFEYIQPLEVFLNKFWKFELFPVVDQNYVHFDSEKMVGIHDEEIYRYLNQLFKIQDFRFEYRQEIQVEIDFEFPITFWKSPTHKLQSSDVKNSQEAKTQRNNKKIILELQDIPENYESTKLFTLLFSSDEINLPRAILSHTNNDALQYQKYCATLTFIPKFNEVQLDDAYTQYLEGQRIAENQVINRGNYLFIIDRSGSMSGSRIKKAKECLILFLKSLPQDSEFNIISFGSSFQPLFETSQKYSQLQLDVAIMCVELMDADMGGTDIIIPLTEMVYNANYGKNKNTTLNVFLITDGEDSAGPIIKLIQDNNLAETRIYTLGIGNGCSQYLIKRMAEVGNGKHQIVSDKEDINEKVIDLLEDSLTPYLQAFTLESNLSNIASIIPNPESIVCLKKNQELTIQILFSMVQYYEQLEFQINCFDPQNQKKIQYSVSLNLNQSINNEYFHKLAAYKFITYFENSIQYNQQQVNFIKLNKQNLDQEDIINLSIQNQILCSRTAFVNELYYSQDSFEQQINHRSIKVKSSAIDLKGRRQFSINSGFETDFQTNNQSQNSSCCCRGGSSENYSVYSSFNNTQLRQQQYVQQTQPLLEQQIQSLNKADTIDNDKLMYQKLIKFSQADGSFLINPEIESTINFQNLENHENLKEDVWFTFLALLYLENKLSQFKKSWQLVFFKGVVFLKQNGIDYKVKRNEYIIL